MCAFAATAYLICSPGNEYRHYGMAVIPIFAVMVCIDIAFVFRFLKKRKYIVGALCCIAALWLSHQHIREDLQLLRQHLGNGFQGLEVQDGEIIELIQEKTNKNDVIQVLGNRCDIYLNSDRMAASKYIYQEPIALLRPEIMDELAEDVAEAEPKLIVEYCPQMERVWDGEGNMGEVLKERYHIIYEDDRFKVYEIKQEKS